MYLLCPRHVQLLSLSCHRGSYRGSPHVSLVTRVGHVTRLAGGSYVLGLRRGWTFKIFNQEYLLCNVPFATFTFHYLMVV